MAQEIPGFIAQNIIYYLFSPSSFEVVLGDPWESTLKLAQYSSSFMQQSTVSYSCKEEMTKRNPSTLSRPWAPCVKKRNPSSCLPQDSFL